MNGMNGYIRQAILLRKWKWFQFYRRYRHGLCCYRIIQVSTLLGGIEFIVMLLFGDLTERVKPVVLGAVFAGLIILKDAFL